MASVLATANVTVLRSYVWGGHTGKAFIARVCKITVPKADATAYGDGTNTLPAAAFRLSYIMESTPMNGAADIIIPTLPKPDGTVLYTYSLVVVTDANRAAITALVARVDSNNDGTYYVTVKGY